MIRFFDILLASLGIFVLSPLMLSIFLLCFFDTGSPIFIQRRLGNNRRSFKLCKFRTMRVGTDDLPTHLVLASAVTNLGRLLRRTKLDELPQLFNVVVGDMSLVGPRPCLESQAELISARAAVGVLAAKPGVTGLAQIRGIDMSAPQLLAQTDAEMLRKLNLRFYFYLIFATIIGRGSGDRVK